MHNAQKDKTYKIFCKDIVLHKETFTNKTRFQWLQHLYCNPQENKYSFRWRAIKITEVFVKSRLNLEIQGFYRDLKTFQKSASRIQGLFKH